MTSEQLFIAEPEFLNNQQVINNDDSVLVIVYWSVLAMCEIIRPVFACTWNTTQTFSFVYVVNSWLDRNHGNKF
jgi:hypothetical protein